MRPTFERFACAALACLMMFTSCSRTLDTVSLSPPDSARMEDLVAHEQSLDTLVGKHARVTLRTTGRALQGTVVEITPRDVVLLEASPERTVRVARSSIRTFELIDASNTTNYMLAASLLAVLAVGLAGFFDLFNPIWF
ncbi:MAG: hypothetical protein HKN20_06200 [Gemmatimonadetes bacterium]|nr:hypothetical protein [Gemmatimonadota bacterium]